MDFFPWVVSAVVGLEVVIIVAVHIVCGPWPLIMASPPPPPPVTRH